MAMDDTVRNLLVGELLHWRKYFRDNNMTDADYHDADGEGWISRLDRVLKAAGALVPVRFRVSTDSPEREVTAVFMSRETHPTTSAANRVCYAHAGQHSECSLAWMNERTRAATREEYAPLLAELRRIYEAEGSAVLEVQP